jgi:uncharacterized protein (TIRG00374 family)
MKRWFGITFTILIVALLVYLLKDIDFLQVYELILNMNPLYLILAVVSLGLTYVLWTLRWQISMSTLAETKFGYSFKVLLAGTFLNTITPGAATGGEPARAYFLKRRYKKPKTKFFGAILADKAIHIGVFICFFIFSLLFLLFFISMPPNMRLFLEVLLVLILLAFVSFVFAVFKNFSFGFSSFLIRMYRFGFIKSRFKTKTHFSLYLNNKMSNITGTLSGILRNEKIIAKGVFISILFWILTYLSSYFVFLAFGFRVQIVPIIIVVTFGIFIGDLSPVPGGIGLVEGSTFLLYSALGIPEPLAATVALLSRLITYFYSLFIGGLMLVILKYER